MPRFQVKEHIIRCQHTRDRPAGVEFGRDNELKLHVKQYTPLSNLDPKPGDVTIIGAQANGFPKELYEPFWDDLREQMEASGRQIRSIWIADIASQGQSGVINEKLLGAEGSWWDHGRDLLFMINQFQDEMPAPLIGIGHSVGAVHVAHLSLMHPRLLHSILLLDPTVHHDIRKYHTIARVSGTRRDVWPSRNIAAAKYAAGTYHKSWDKRVFAKWIKYGLRDLPTEKYPDPSKYSEGSETPVTLTTTKSQEVFFYVRANFPEDRLLQDDEIQRDLHPNDRFDWPWARPETQEIFRRLPDLTPSVLYIFGAHSLSSPPHRRFQKVNITGIGAGGSGGAVDGMVKEALVDAGHLVTMERPRQCAEAASKFIVGELERWDMETKHKADKWNSLTREQHVEISEQWKDALEIEPRWRSTQKAEKKAERTSKI